MLAETNKDIVQAQIDDVSDEQTPVAHKFDLTQDGSPGGRRFEYVVEALDRDTTLRFTLLDVDGIRSRDPVRLSLAAIDDEAPQLRVQLSGIGTAITPQARVPISGEISDDYGVAKAWFECHADDKEPVAQPLEIKIDGRDLLMVDEAIEVEHFACAEAEVSSGGRRGRQLRTGRRGENGRQPTVRARRRHAGTIAVDSRSPRAVAPPAVRNHRPGTDRNSRRAGPH